MALPQQNRDKQMDAQDVIVTLRRLLAAIVVKHGNFARVVIQRSEIEAIANGKLKVRDRPDGTIELIVEGAKVLLDPIRVH